MHRIILALLLSVAGIGPTRAAPAEPWLPDLCTTLAKDFTKAVGFPVTAAVGAPKTIIDSAPAGTACLFSGKGTGLGHAFNDAERRLKQIVKGWKEKLDVAADGPDSTVQGYRKGDREVIIALDREPPAGQCVDAGPSDCTLPAKRWQWTFKGAAYRK